MTRNFILDEVSYSSNEAMKAHEIRTMPSGEKRRSLIKYFEIETGKPFPYQRTITTGFNFYTALMSSSHSEQAAGMVENDRMSRTDKVEY